MTDKRKAAPGQEAANQDALVKQGNDTTGQPVKGGQTARSTVKMTERQLMVLDMLLTKPQTVDEIRLRTRANNVGEIIAELRRKNYLIYTERREFVTKEGKRSRYGIYHLLPESIDRATEVVRRGW